MPTSFYLRKGYGTNCTNIKCIKFMSDVSMISIKDSIGIYDIKGQFD